jgi:anthranilate phosphoribosyltransferase
MKGETPEEIVGFIRAMRKNMIPVALPGAIDICGTGGDGKSTFNISTAVAFVLAGAGVKIAKHGNRSASSRCGSADVLEALGVTIALNPKQAEAVFAKTGLVFLFAPLYHPALKQVMGVRKELAIRTIFNFLGPFANPASVEKQMIGVPNREIAAKLAEAAKMLGYKHLLIVTGTEGLDEISTSSTSHLFEVKQRWVKQTLIDPTTLGFKKVSHRQIAGGDKAYNAVCIRDILQGKKGPKRDIVVLNSAFALTVAGRAKTIHEGISIAENSIDRGKAKEALESLVKETRRYA